jgi:hypothetical protein
MVNYSETLNISGLKLAMKINKILAKKAGNVRITLYRGVFMQPLLQWKVNQCHVFRVFVCSLRCLANNEHAQCCHLWPVRLYNIFPPCLAKARFP